MRRDSILLNMLILIACLSFFAGTGYGAVKLVQSWHGQQQPAEPDSPVAPCPSGSPLTDC